MVHTFISLLLVILVFSCGQRLKKLFSRKQTRAEAHQLLSACVQDVRQLLMLTNTYPLMLRLAWSDCATFDKSVRMWPQCGGAVGAVRFESEYRHSNNAGLLKAISLLEPIRAEHPEVSWADIIQMAGALAVELTGGPKIRNMLYGRLDAPNFHEERITLSCPVRSLEAQKKAIRHKDAAKDRRTHMHENDAGDTPVQLASRLPQALPPYPDGATIPGVHIRNNFYRMGFNNKEIVALCGAHTIGRAYSDRSNCTIFSSGPQGATKFTRPTSCPWGTALGTAEAKQRGIGMSGGCSWTRNWLQFDNSYFRGSVNNGSDDDKEHPNELPRAILSTMRQMRRTSLVGGATPGAVPVASIEGEELKHFPKNFVERNPVSQNWINHERDPELLWLPTDNALQTDPEFRTHFQRYSEDQDAFFHDYALAHKKMSELGARFGDEHGPISLEDEPMTVPGAKDK